jgi:protease-4
MRVKEKKPVVVSMGSLAASGGYYIACAADSIFASPYTLTGSIGVFGIMFNAQRLLNEKLGVTIDTVLTARSADFPNGSRPMSEIESAA